jgi:hypothetical protein
MTAHKTRNLLIDRRNGVRSHDLMRNYDLSEKRLEQVLRILRRSDLVALRRLWEQDKLTDAEFTRAFDEVEHVLTIDE